MIYAFKKSSLLRVHASSLSRGYGEKWGIEASYIVADEVAIPNVHLRLVRLVQSG
jgi:hypothetical protein